MLREKLVYPLTKKVSRTNGHRDFLAHPFKIFNALIAETRGFPHLETCLSAHSSSYSVEHTSLRQNLQSTHIFILLMPFLDFVPPDSMIALCGVFSGVGGHLLGPAALRRLLLLRQELPKKAVCRGSQAEENLRRVFLCVPLKIMV